MNAYARLQGRSLVIAGVSMVTLMALARPAAAVNEFPNSGAVNKPVMQLYLPPKATLSPSGGISTYSTTVPNAAGTPSTPSTPSSGGGGGAAGIVPVTPNKPVIPTNPDRPPTTIPRQPPTLVTPTPENTTNTPRGPERPTTFTNLPSRPGNLGQVTSINNLMTAPGVVDFGTPRQTVPNKLENRMAAPLSLTPAAARSDALNALENAKPLM